MFLEHRGDLWLSSGLTVLGADGGMGAIGHEARWGQSGQMCGSGRDRELWVL